jgi:hypothetical protein
LNNYVEWEIPELKFEGLLTIIKAANSIGGIRKVKRQFKISKLLFLKN